MKKQNHKKIRQKLRTNNQALSVMYDAIFFIVFISLSGAILLPAMMNPTAVQSSVERHREQIVDETLLTLMTARDPEFEYIFAGEQIKSFLGEYMYDEDETTFLGTVIEVILGKELRHKTYADLIVENLASQLQIFNHRINIFTTDYDTAIAKSIDTVLTENLGDKYVYNLSVQWFPINGVPFGGSMQLGPNPPTKNTHVAQCKVSMPATPFSDFLLYLKSHIETVIAEELVDVEEDIIRNIITTLIDMILYDGFNDGENHIPGIIDGTIDFVFGYFEGAIDSIFDEAMKLISDSIGNFGLDFGEMFSDMIKDAISETFEEIVAGTVNEAIDGLKTHVKDTIKDYISDFFDPLIDILVENIINALNVVEDISDVVLSFILAQFDVLRAQFTLTIWEATA